MTTFSELEGTALSEQIPQAGLLDGSRIYQLIQLVDGGTVDGVDISVFFNNYLAHLSDKTEHPHFITDILDASGAAAPKNYQAVKVLGGEGVAVEASAEGLLISVSGSGGGGGFGGGIDGLKGDSGVVVVADGFGNVTLEGGENITVTEDGANHRIVIAASNVDAKYLNGFAGSYYLAAENLTGVVPVARLVGTYNINISGTAADADRLGGQLPSYYATSSDLNNAIGDISALMDVPLLALTASNALNQERIFTAGDGLIGVDSGAGLAYTLVVGAGAGLTVNTDNVALTTPGSLSVNSINDPNDNHTHAIVSSSNPGATASLLATDAYGGIRLDTNLLYVDAQSNQVGIGTSPIGAYKFSVLGATRLDGAVDVDNLLSYGAVEVREDLTIYRSDDLTTPVLYVDASQRSIGINRDPDPQMDVDIAGALRAKYLIGKHAIQLSDAALIVHFDNTLAGHRGQVATEIRSVSFGSGKFEGGIVLDLGAVSYQNPLSAMEGCIMEWWQPEKASASQNTSVFFDGGGLMGYWNQDDQRFYLTDGTNTVSTDPQSFNAGEFIHLAFSWGPAGLKLYVNGLLAASGSYTAPTLNSTLYIGSTQSNIA